MEDKNKKMENTFFKDLTLGVSSLVDKFQATWIGGVIGSILNYMSPIKDIMHLLLFLFIADVFFGFWAAKKLRNESFSVKIIWSNTVPRMLISISIILATFLWDQVYGMTDILTHRMVGGFFSGMLIYSIILNGFKVTKWGILGHLLTMIKNKIKEKTGINVEETENENNP